MAGIYVGFPLMADDVPMIINSEGVHGYEDTPYLPWIDYRVHDNTRPRPPHVEAQPTTTSPPSDAIVIFNGKSMSQWKTAEGWKVSAGAMVTGKEAMYSKQAFGNCQSNQR